MMSVVDLAAHFSMPYSLMLEIIVSNPKLLPGLRHILVQDEDGSRTPIPYLTSKTWHLMIHE